ncbi:MAG: exonuclease domain-containing protein [Lachnospiraceae bacterium]|nr:exonuclease domain-containing protein [Lachnospiraceae bacterium]
MKTYIVFDLEWNQSPHGKEESIEDFPFEIIEIGAVKLDEQFHRIEEFHRLIRPQVYQQMHYVISEVTHMDMEELQSQGEDFATAAADFVRWCGPEAVYCTWGSMDLAELQRNLKYYQIENPFKNPLYYYDVQKLYGLLYREGAKPSLDVAVEELGLLEDRPFHRALDDAYYTGRVLEVLSEDPGAEQLLQYWSVDYFRLPASREEELRMTFPSYSKYVSRIFPSREAAMADRGVTEMKCYMCGRTLRKKVRWFTPNQKIYYGLANCPEHGYLKGKLRIKKVDDDRVFVIRTLKFTDEEGVERIMERKEYVRKKRSERNKAKRKRQQQDVQQKAVRKKKKTPVECG